MKKFMLVWGAHLFCQEQEQGWCKSWWPSTCRPSDATPSKMQLSKFSQNCISPPADATEWVESHPTYYFNPATISSSHHNPDAYRGATDTSFDEITVLPLISLVFRQSYKDQNGLVDIWRAGKNTITSKYTCSQILCQNITWFCVTSW